MIYRMFFGEGEIEALKDYANIDAYAKRFYDKSISINNIHLLSDPNYYCIFNGYLIFEGRVYCDDKIKLEELYNLFILVGGKFSYESESESATLLIDCIKLLGEL